MSASPSHRSHQFGESELILDCRSRGDTTSVTEAAAVSTPMRMPCTILFSYLCCCFLAGDISCFLSRIHLPHLVTPIYHLRYPIPVPSPSLYRFTLAPELPQIPCSTSRLISPLSHDRNLARPNVPLSLSLYCITILSTPSRMFSHSDIDILRKTLS